MYVKSLMVLGALYCLICAYCIYCKMICSVVYCVTVSYSRYILHCIFKLNGIT